MVWVFTLMSIKIPHIKPSVIEMWSMIKEGFPYAMQEFSKRGISTSFVCVPEGFDS